MAISKEIKNEILKRLAQGEKVKDIVKNFNVSSATVYNWKKELVPSTDKVEEYVQAVEEEKQKIKSLLDNKQYKEAEEAYLRSPYKEEEELVVLYTKVLWRQDRFEEAIPIFEDVKYKNSTLVQENYLFCLSYLQEYNKVFSICERLKGCWTAKIAFYYVKYIAKKEGIEQALVEIEASEFKDSDGLVLLKIKSLITLKHFEEALALCEENAFRNNGYILKEELRILGTLHRHEEAYQKAIKSEYKNSLPIKKQIVYNLCHQYIFEEKKDIQLLKKAAQYIDVRKPIHKDAYSMLEKLANEAELDLEMLTSGKEIPNSIEEQYVDSTNIENKQEIVLEDTCVKEKEEIEYLIECYRLKEAKRKIERSNYKEELLYLYTKILWLDGKVEEALEIWTNPKYKNALDTQIVYLEYMYSKKEYDAVLKRSRELENFKSSKVFYYYVKAIFKTEGIDVALQVLNASTFKEQDDVFIVALKSYLLGKQGKFENALELCQNSVHREEKEITREEIYHLGNLKRYQEAYTKALHCEYRNTVVIRTQLVQLLCYWYVFGEKKDKNLLEKAKEYIVSHALKLSKKHFEVYLFLLDLTKGKKAKYKAILSSPFKEEELKRLEEKRQTEIQEEESVSEIKKEIDEEVKQNREVLGEQLAFIYQGISNLQQIESLEIGEYEKHILILAHLHKNRREEALRRIKTIKKEYLTSPKELTIFNKIKAQIENKKSLFDITVYSGVLHVLVDFKALENVHTEESKKQEFVASKPKENKIGTLGFMGEGKSTLLTESFEQTNTSIKDIQSSKYISSKDLVVPTIFTKQKKNTNSKNEINKEKEKGILIKDLFEREILEVSAFIYVEMQSVNPKRKRDAIRAWDIFENLIYKPASDGVSLEKMKNFLLRISYSNQISVDPLLKNAQKVRK